MFSWFKAKTPKPKFAIVAHKKEDGSFYYHAHFNSKYTGGLGDIRDKMYIHFAAHVGGYKFGNITQAENACKEWDAVTFPNYHYSKIVRAW